MPVSAEPGNAHAGPVVELMSQVELDQLEAVAKVLRGDQTDPQWAATALARIAAWRAQAERGVAGARQELGKAVRVALLGAQTDGAAAALADLPGTPAAAPLQPRGIHLSEQRLGKTLAAALQHVPHILEQHLREAVRASVAQVHAEGTTLTRRAGSQQVLDKLVKQGITGFRDKAGRNWSLSSYTEMAVRTELQTAALEAGDHELREVGLDLIVVSDSPRECPVCAPYEGGVLSLDGPPGQPPETVTRASEVGGAPVQVRVLTSLATARAAGFQHPNCTHSYSGFVPGATELEPADTNPDGYEEKQHQRHLERKVREWKRAEVLALDPAAQQRAAAKVRDWQAALRQHVKSNGLKRQPGRESITRAV